MAQVGILSPTTGTIVNSSQMEAGTGNGDYYRLIPGGTGAGTNAGQWRVGSFFIAGVSAGQRGTDGLGTDLYTQFGNPYGRSGVSGWGAYNVSGSDQYGSLCYFRFASGAFNSNLINNTTAVSSGQRWSLVSNSNSAPGFPSVIPGSITPGAFLINSAFGQSGTTSDGVEWGPTGFFGGSNYGPEYVNTRDNRGGTPGGLTPGGGRAAIFLESFQGDVQGYAIGGGGDGLDIKPSGSGSSGNPFRRGASGFDGSFATDFTLNNHGAQNANGGNYGGGGGVFSDWYDTYNIFYNGYGGAGRVWFTYVRPTATGLTQIPSVVAKGSTYTIQVQSYWDGTFNGQFTVPTNASTGVQPFYVTDSRGARVAFFANVAVPPTINSFTAQDQFNTNGIPIDDVTFSWNLTNVSGVAFTVQIYKGSISPSNLLYSTGAQLIGSATLSTGLQSVAGSNSPASDTFILKVTIAGGDYNEASTVASVYNDNTPTTINISDDGIAPGGPVDRTELEPNTTYYTQVTFDGVDMTVIADPTSSGTSVSDNTVNWTTDEKLIPLGSDLYVRYTSLPFNTDTTPGGTNAAGEIIGQTNSRNINCDLGSTSFSFTITTRAPVIEETFNFEIPVDAGAFPNPDIDTVTIPVTTLYREADASQTADDIEIDNEIKTSDGNAQVRINGGDWLDMRQI